MVHNTIVEYAKSFIQLTKADIRCVSVLSYVSAKRHTSVSSCYDLTYFNQMCVSCEGTVFCVHLFDTHTASLHTVWNTSRCNCVTMLPQILFSTSSVPETLMVYPHQHLPFQISWMYVVVSPVSRVADWDYGPVLPPAFTVTETCCHHTEPLNWIAATAPSVQQQEHCR